MAAGDSGVIAPWETPRRRSPPSYETRRSPGWHITSPLPRGPPPWRSADRARCRARELDLHSAAADRGARGRLCRPRRAMQGPRERGEISTHQFCQMKHSRTYMYIYYWFSSCFCRGWILHVHERLSLNPVSNSTVHCIHSWGIRYLMTMCASAS
jgi:hypothetical protein